MNNSIPLAQSASPPLTPAQKAAIILALLPRETAKAIVADISDDHLSAFIRAIEGMTPPPTHARQEIAQEFVSEVLRRLDDIPGGREAASRILNELTDQARAEKLLSAPSAQQSGAADRWRRAAALPTDRLVSFLQAQRIPTAAAILSSLPADRSAEILSSAPVDFSQAIMAAIVMLDRPTHETSEAIAQAMETALFNAPSQSKATDAASAVSVDILDLVPGSLRTGLIAHLEKSDPRSAAFIRKKLLTFETLPSRLNEAAVAALVRSADRATMMNALKHGETNAAETVAFLLANMSKRMADQLREEISAIPSPSALDGESAQRSVVAVVKTLENSGAIKLKPAT